MEQTNLFNFKVKYLNKREFHLIKDENFGDQVYKFDSKKKSPVIFDIGAHIGISTLYFKSIFPDSEIHCFEPNPELVEVLNENILINGLENIEVHEVAISNREGNAKLYIDTSVDKWHSNSSLLIGGWTKKEILTPIEVKLEILSKYLIDEVDMLKIDVEGHEYHIVQEIQNELNNVLNIAIEIHPGQDIKKISDILDHSGFKLQFIQNGKFMSSPDTSKLLVIKGSRGLK